MLIAILFKIAKSQKEPKCPLAEEWIKKDVVHVYNGILLSHKMNEIVPFIATQMDQEIILLSKITQRQVLYDITYIWNLIKYDTK